MLEDSTDQNVWYALIMFLPSERSPKLRFVLVLLFLSPACIQAGLLSGNFWPNPSLESDTNSDGLPDFWHKGGNITAIDLWTTSMSVSPAHAFQLNDTSTSGYGEWYSDLLDINAGTNYLLRYNLRYLVTNVGPMRVTGQFTGPVPRELPPAS